MIDSKRVSDICVKYEISFNQFFILYCIMKDDILSLKNYVKINKLSLNDVKDLEDKNLIIIYNRNWYENKTLAVTDIIINPSFTDQIISDPLIATTEIIEAYFNVIEVNGKRYPARNISAEDLQQTYKSIYDHDPEKHKEILNATKVYVQETGRTENNITIGTIGLKKFIDSKFYESYLGRIPNSSNNDSMRDMYE